MLELMNVDAVSLSLATGLATLLVLALKALFFLARRLAKGTPTAIDDKFIDQTESALKEKSKDI
jgi:hypothetical protein